MKIIVNMACGLANRMFQYSYYLLLKHLGYNVQVDFYHSAQLAHEKVAWNDIFPEATIEQASSWDVFKLGDLGRVQVAVMVLIGRCDLAWGSDNPFTTADRLLKAGDKPTFTLVDFHAQATSEKLAMAYYLDGRVSALWGTHTHVPTADERVFPQGTGYITDLGMTGAVESVLGIRPDQSVESFLGGLPGRYRPAEGPCKAQGALFTLDSATGLCTAVERVDIR